LGIFEKKTPERMWFLHGNLFGPVSAPNLVASAQKKFFWLGGADFL